MRLSSLLCCCGLLGFSLAATCAETGVNADGFLQQWLLLEPLKVSGQLSDSAVRAAVGQAQLPSPATEVPHEGDSVTLQNTTLHWHAVKTTAYNLNLYHFAHGLGLPTSNVLFWAVTVVNAPRDMNNVRLAIGSNSASQWWVNGQQVISLFNERQTVIDDGVSPRLTLKAGRNVIRAVIINAGGATDFTARFLDDNGKPVINTLQLAF